MLSPALTELLVLQDRDLRRHQVQDLLKAMPREVAAVEARIASEKAAIEAARIELRGLEAQKKLLETEIGSIQDKVAKYRTQQLSVKKNDEYQALGREIETMTGQVQALEGKELEVMYAIDAAKVKFAGAEKTLKDNIVGHEGHIKVLRDREVNLTGESKEAESAFLAARTPVPEPALRQYDRVATRMLPAVVAIRGGKCSGCHLKVSSEVESGARTKTPALALPVCDQCGRIVYWES